MQSEQVRLCNKYAPTSIEDYLGVDSEVNTSIKNVVVTKDIKLIFLVGSSGSGKTRFAKILAQKYLQQFDSKYWSNIYEKDDIITTASGNLITPKEHITGKEEPFVYILDDFEFISGNAQREYADMINTANGDALFIICVKPTDLHFIMSEISNISHLSIRLNNPPLNVLSKFARDIADNEGVKVSPDFVEVFASSSFTPPSIREILCYLEGLKAEQEA